MAMTLVAFALALAGGPTSVQALQDGHRVENPALLGVVPVRRQGGAVVAHVLEDSPAAAAGLAVGDCLLRVAGEKVAAPPHVDRALATRAPGDTIEVRYRRGEDERTARIELVARRALASPLLRARPRGQVGFAAPEWIAYHWWGHTDGPPTRTNTAGKVVVIHCFQSW